MRNWYYFVWLCGDHIVEQHIHNLDVINWLKGDYPVRAQGQGGRQFRTGKEYGEIYDHHYVEFEYKDGTRMFSQCRHMEHCWNSVSPPAGLVYDVFGNQKTAAKFSIGRYEQAVTTGFSESYNPLQLTTASVAWTDLNGDGVPQGELGCKYLTPGCEINLAQLPKGFGVASLANFDHVFGPVVDLRRFQLVQVRVVVAPRVLQRFEPRHASSPHRASTGVATSEWRGYPPRADGSARFGT